MSQGFIGLASACIRLDVRQGLRLDLAVQLAVEPDLSWRGDLAVFAAGGAGRLLPGSVSQPFCDRTTGLCAATGGESEPTKNVKFCAVRPWPRGCCAKALSQRPRYPRTASAGSPVIRRFWSSLMCCLSQVTKSVQIRSISASVGMLPALGSSMVRTGMSFWMP